MNIVLFLGAVAIVLILSITFLILMVRRCSYTVPIKNPTRDICIRSLYICVVDMERAIAFYESFFEQKVTKRDEIYSVFEIYSFRFGLFAFEKKHEAHSYGNNWVAEFEDTEGNHIEVTALMNR